MEDFSGNKDLEMGIIDKKLHKGVNEQTIRWCFIGDEKVEYKKES